MQRSPDQRRGWRSRKAPHRVSGRGQSGCAGRILEGAPSRSLVGQDSVERTTGIVERLDGGFALRIGSGKAELVDDSHELSDGGAVEAEQASERIKAAKERRAENGEWRGGIPTYGCRAVDKKLVIDRAETDLLGGGLTVCATCGNRLIAAGKRLEAFDRDSPVRRLLKCTKFVNGPTACNSNLVDHDLLESFVFETLITSFAKNERWQQSQGEKAPDVHARIDSLEGPLAGLTEQQRRINELYIAGDIDRVQHSAQVQRVKDEDTALRR